MAHDPAARPSAAQLAQACGGSTIDRSRLAEAASRIAAGMMGAVVAEPGPAATLPDVSPVPVPARRLEGATISDMMIEAPSVRSLPEPQRTASPALRSGAEPVRSATDAVSPGAEPAHTVAEPARARDAMARVRAPRFSWTQVATIVSAVLIALVLGAVVGRVSARMRMGGLVILGAAQRKVELLIDGKTVKMPADGVALPLSPGRHTVTVLLPKGEHREYPLTVRAGEKIVVVPMARSGAIPDTDER
jgi:eukaryotic-like serine/threonine-protein kinase